MPFIQQGQAQKHVTHNEALRILDGVVQLSVASRQLTDPPATAEPGGRFIVATGDTEAWAGHDGDVAVSELSGGWHFLTPRIRWLAWVEDEAHLAVQRGGTDGWTAAETGAADTLGLNAAADTTNRLAVAAEATLLSHDGAGHQVKVNKAGAGDTASLLYQTAFSGRAEMGLAGTDDFSIKVSADGVTWKQALWVDGQTGRTDLAPNATVGGHPVTHAGNVSGPSIQGGAVERTITPDGTCTRWADGTMICTHILTGHYANTERVYARWNFPLEFSEMSVCSAMLSLGDIVLNSHPAMTEIAGIHRGASTPTYCDLFVFRAAGRTNFDPGDTLELQVTEIGRWF